MKVAITGGTGFVGRHLAKRLTIEGHQVVLVSRGVDERDPEVRKLDRTEFRAVGVSDQEGLVEAFEGCDAVAHLAGINREIGEQTYERVHVEGTRNVVEACRRAGVGKVLLLSFLRARPDCGSKYHESKWEAEEIVRSSKLDYTVFKAGVIYGRGDHMLDHISHALHTFPVFLLVGFKPTPMAPLAVEDLTYVMKESICNGRLSNATVPITGPEQMPLREAAARIAKAVGRRPLVLPAPLWVHYAMAWVFERTMQVPLAAKAQVRILSESLVEPTLAPDELPEDLKPRTEFTQAQIRKGLPEPGGFTMKDCLSRIRHSEG